MIMSPCAKHREVVNGNDETCCCRRRNHAPCLPASLFKAGEKGTVVRISGKEETKKFLAGLGFTAGSHICAVHSVNGSMILEVKGARIAIDRDMAEHIMICPES